MQTLGLSNAYRDEKDVRSSSRKLMALPLIPLAEIRQAFEEIARTAPNSVHALLRYFRGYWMTRVKMTIWHGEKEKPKDHQPSKSNRLSGFLVSPRKDQPDESCGGIISPGRNEEVNFSLITSGVIIFNFLISSE